MTGAISSSPSVSGRQREHYLDGIRGLAILFVVFSHLSNSGFHLFPGLNLGGIGKYGVWLFFVLSAYLLSAPLAQQLSRHESKTVTIASYFVARFARIFPLYFVVLVGHALWGGFGVDDVLQHLMLFRGDREFWAIPVEFKFYLILPFIISLFLWLGRGRVMSAILGTSCIIAATLYFTPPRLIDDESIQLGPYLGIFLFGFCLSMAHANELQFPKTLSFLAIVIFVGVLLTTPSFIQLAPERLHAWALVYGIAWAIFIGIVASSDRARHICSHPVLRFYGRVSFSLYLLHMPVIHYVTGLHWATSWQKSLIILSISSGLSLVTWRIIETPGIQFGRFLAWNLRQRFANASAGG